MLEYKVFYIAISGKKNHKIFRNPNDVLNFIARYDVENINVYDDTSLEVYTSNEFEEAYQNVTS